jgi:LuxR family maltose regulon positive regulatory protein
MAQAWLLSIVQRMELVPNLLRQAEDLARQRGEAHSLNSTPWIIGWIHALWCLVELLRWNLDGAISHAQQALASVPAGHVYVRGVTIVYYALALRYKGHYREALELCAQALVHEQEEVWHRVLAAFGMLATYEGDLHGLAAAGERNLRSAGARKMSRPDTWGHVFLGVAKYERNDLNGAEQHFRAALEESTGVAVATAIDATYGLALTRAAIGDSSGAHFWAERLAAIAIEAENVYLVAVAQWFSCRLILQDGGLPPVPTAHLWCLGKAPSFQYRWAEFPDLTYARLLIAQGTRASLSEAVDLLQRLVEFCERYHLHWRRMEALAVLSLAEQAQGRAATALETLAEAVRLAQPQTFVRTFVDLGPPMASLLYALVSEGVAASYIGQLLSAFPPVGRNTVAIAVAAKRDDEVIEPLSRRELEVLGLLAERLSDKEIAERLRISPLTVRRHSVNLYQKLHVNSRRQAVSRGQTLGLLRPS